MKQISICVLLCGLYGMQCCLSLLGWKALLMPSFVIIVVPVVNMHIYIYTKYNIIQSNKLGFATAQGRIDSLYHDFH